MNNLIRTPLMLMLLIASFGLPAQQQADDPVSLVDSTISNIFSEVNQNLQHYQSDPAALRTLVRTDLIPLLDVKYAARLILGRAGRGIEKQKVDDFANAMIELLIERYSTGLLEFRSSEPVVVLPQRGELNEKMTRVRTRVKLPNGGEVPIDYAFRKTADGWKAFDVVIEGISYITTYRNQIMPDVQANGIDSVIARLNSGDIELAE